MHNRQKTARGGFPYLGRKYAPQRNDCQYESSSTLKGAIAALPKGQRALNLISLVEPHWSTFRSRIYLGISLVAQTSSQP